MLAVSDEATVSGLQHTSYGRLDVTVPQAIYTAGIASTAKVIIRNPFDRPVDIVEVLGPHSANLYGTENADVAARKAGAGSLLKRIFLRELKFSAAGIGVEAQFPRTEKGLNIDADPNSEVNFDADLTPFDSVNVKAREGSKVYLRPPEAPETKSKPVTTKIEAHCEVVAYFQVHAPNWLFFVPARQSMSTQIRYQMDGIERTQVVTSEFEIKPPLKAIVIGSTVGAFLGSSAKALKSAPYPDPKIFLLAVCGSIVMSLIAAVALSRKTAAQAFITVEDFFGGFVIGALIGYGGSDYFDKALFPKDPK